VLPILAIVGIKTKIDAYLDFIYKSSEIELKIAEAARLDQQRNLKFTTLTDPGKFVCFNFFIWHTVNCGNGY